MRFGRSRVVLISVLVIVCWGVPIASGQQSAKPLTEKELIFLLEKKVSASALTNMVQSFGVTFQPDAELLDRLKKAGATDADAMRVADPASKRVWAGDATGHEADSKRAPVSRADF